MKVRFRQTGGFVSIFMGCDLDTDTLSAAEAGKLLLLVEESGILTLQSAVVPGARDVRYYEISVEQVEVHHEVTFDQLSVPLKVKPLLRFPVQYACGVRGQC